MAAPKKIESDDVAEAVAEEAAPDAKLPKPYKRSQPTGPFTNTTFAERAKGKGGNKRVASSESK